MARPSQPEPSAHPDPAPLPSYEQIRPASSSSARNRHSTDDFLPSYEDLNVDLSQGGFTTRADVTDDGRVNISINEKTHDISRALQDGLSSQLNEEEPPPVYIPPGLGGIDPPPLNIVIQVVGSRGDVQPFVALGKVLRATYNHRIRLATHPTFKEFVEKNGLEFFSIGGDPAELMAFMVKNPGLMPGMQSLRDGDVGKRQKGIHQILNGCWRSCYETGDGMVDPALKGKQPEDEPPVQAGEVVRPFIADAIIANPPSFAHVHIAEKLGLPLHMMFTMPWSPTQFFPHPLTTIQASNAGASVTNFLSYGLVETMTWQGLGEVINRFRSKVLNLEVINPNIGSGIVNQLKIPYTYCWSPALIPKPKDWGSHISVSGFYFLSLASSFTPDPALAAFLEAGPPPVYIGFGSIVVDNPDALTKLIFAAVAESGQRALVSQGWGGLGGDSVPDGVFMLGNVPHDWLFKHVSCVVHHGGAGTTSAGIALGKPTIIVPFFGDQPFWGAMVARAGAGPEPIPYKKLTAENLAEAITFALRPETQERANELGERISREKGTEMGAQAFHERLGVDALRCDLSPGRTAVWRHKESGVQMSAFAAAVLANDGLIKVNDLRLFRSREYDIDSGPTEPITGGLFPLLNATGGMLNTVANIPIDIGKAMVKGTDGLRRPDPTYSAVSGPAARSSTSLDQARPDLSREPSLQPTDSRTSLDRKSTLSPTATDTRSNLSRADSNASTSSKPKASSSFVYGFLSEFSGNRALARDASGDPESTPLASPDSDEPDFKKRTVAADAALGAGRSIGKIAEIGMKVPMDFSMGIAKGFRNAPKLYGDTTVRPTQKVTGFHSGFRVAGKEFGLGLYDGVTGIVTQPIKGAKEAGVLGAVTGFARGIGGLVLKPGAAVFGIPGYTFTGVYREMQKHFGAGLHSYIIASRIAQGFAELSECADLEAESKAIIEKWKTKPAKKKNELLVRWQSAREERKQRKEEKQKKERELRFGSQAWYDEAWEVYDTDGGDAFLQTSGTIQGEQKKGKDGKIQRKPVPTKSEETLGIPSNHDLPDAELITLRDNTLNDEGHGVEELYSGPSGSRPPPLPSRPSKVADDSYYTPHSSIPDEAEDPEERDLRLALEASRLSHHSPAPAAEPVHSDRPHDAFDEDAELARILEQSQREHELAEAERKGDEALMEMAVRRSLAEGR